jgi:Recombinase
MAKLKTIEQRRKADRERLKLWRKKKLGEGNKHIHLMLTPEAQDVLKDEKARTGEPYVRLINQAIISMKDRIPKVPMDKREEREHEQEAIHDLILKMDREGKNQSQISKHLNDKGIPTLSGKGKWFPATVRNILRKEKGVT